MVLGFLSSRNRVPPALAPGTGNAHPYIEGAVGVAADSGLDAVEMKVFADSFDEPGLNTLGAFLVLKIHRADGVFGRAA